MITPDDAGSNKGKPSPGRAMLLGVAALVVFGGIVVLGNLTTPGPARIENSTTTTTEGLDPPLDTGDFTVSQIARGIPFDWRSNLTVERGYPLELLDHRGDIYLFVIDAPDFNGFRATGLRAWKSGDGVMWESLGQVIPEGHVISGVSSAGEGLVALEPGSAGAGFTVWRSSDGVEWEPEDVAVDAPSNLVVMRPVSSGGTEGLLVVSENRELHVANLIGERLGVRYGDTVQMGPYGWSTDIDFEGDLGFTLYGPVGLPLAFVTADELGLTEEERALITDIYEDSDRRSIWVETDTGWTIREIPDATVVQWIGGTPDGRVIAIGYGSRGLNAWATRDASSWESLPSFPGPYHIDHWRDRIVGPSAERRATLLASDGDGGWDEIGPSWHLPDDLDWSVGEVAAGPGGVAAIINGWGNALGPAMPDRPPTLTDGGAVLTLDFRAGVYSIEIPDSGATHTWSTGRQLPRGVEPDLDGGTISFRDPDTGELLGTFAFDDINASANEYWSDQGSRENVQAFAFTDDPIDWTIQELTALGDVEIAHLEVTGSHVVAAGIHDDFNATTQSGFELWSAEIP